MADQTSSVDALAKQFGGVEVPAVPDVDALAKQFGGTEVSSGPITGVSPAGLTTLKQREGGFRAEPYQDSGTGLAIGYGMHTWQGKPVTADLRVTQEQADQELERQLRETYLPHLSGLTAPITQPQYDSLASIAWNSPAAARELVQKLNAGGPLTLDDFLASATVNGQRFAPLEERRRQEYAAFEPPTQVVGQATPALQTPAADRSITPEELDVIRRSAPVQQAETPTYTLPAQPVDPRQLEPRAVPEDIRGVVRTTAVNPKTGQRYATTALPNTGLDPVVADPEQIVRGLIEMGHAQRVAVTAIHPKTGQPYQTTAIVPDDTTLHGATEALKGAMGLGSAYVIPGVLKAPVKTLLTLGAMWLSGKGADQLAAFAGGTPAQREFAKTLTEAGVALGGAQMVAETANAIDAAFTAGAKQIRAGVLAGSLRDPITLGSTVPSPMAGATPTAQMLAISEHPSTAAINPAAETGESLTDVMRTALAPEGPAFTTANGPDRAAPIARSAEADPVAQLAVSLGGQDVTPVTPAEPRAPGRAAGAENPATAPQAAPPDPVAQFAESLGGREVSTPEKEAANGRSEQLDAGVSGAGAGASAGAAAGEVSEPPKPVLDFEAGRAKRTHDELTSAMGSLTDEEIAHLDAFDDFGRPLSRADRGLDESTDEPTTPSTPTASTPVPETPSTPEPVVRHNAERGSIEVQFPTKPDPAVTAKLDAAGFRFAKVAKLWYKPTPAASAQTTIAKTRELLGLADPTMAAFNVGDPVRYQGQPYIIRGVGDRALLIGREGDSAAKVRQVSTSDVSYENPGAAADRFQVGDRVQVGEWLPTRSGKQGTVKARVGDKLSVQFDGEAVRRHVDARQLRKVATSQPETETKPEAPTPVPVEPAKLPLQRGAAPAEAAAPTPDHEPTPMEREAFETYLERDARERAAIGPVTAPGVSFRDIPADLAQRAHEGTSWTPESRGLMEQREYVKHLQAVWTWLTKGLTTDEQMATARAEFARYRDSYLAKNRERLQSRSRLISVNVAGPSKFPGARANKLHDQYGRKLREFHEWDQRTQRAMYRAVHPHLGAISSDRSDAVEALQHKIADARRLQETMRQGNTIIRNKSLSREDKLAELQALGLSEKNAYDALKPDYMGRIGFPPYAFQNNLANIKRMEGRVAQITETRAQAPRSATFDGGRIEENRDANRLQVFFDAKPAESVRASLKRHGFHWSPREGAWQRLRNEAAVRAVESLFKVTLSAPTPTAPEPTEPAPIPTPTAILEADDREQSPPETVTGHRPGDGADQRPEPAQERLQPETQRPDRRPTRAATTAQREADGIAQLLADAVAGGYTGSVDALRSELTDRLSLVKELDADFNEAGRNPTHLLRYIAKGGGLSIANETGQKGELRWLKEFQDTRPSRSRRARGNQAAPVYASGQVRGVRGVFRQDGLTLDGMVEYLNQFPEFGYITMRNLVDEIRAAATADDPQIGIDRLIESLGPTWWTTIGTATPSHEDAPVTESVFEAAEPEDGDTSFNPEELESSLEDVNEHGEAQPRLPGASAARQVGQPDTTFRAPQQASGDDFALEAPNEAAARARDDAQQHPSMFGDDEPQFSVAEGENGRADVDRQLPTLVERLQPARNGEQAEHLAAAFLRTPLRNVETGIVVTVSGKSLKKLTSGDVVRRSVSGPAHMTAVGNLHTLFPLATMSEWFAPRDPAYVAGVYQFDVPMPFEGRVVRVSMLAKEMVAAQEGTRLYTLEAIEIGATGSGETPAVAGHFQYDAERAGAADASRPAAPSPRFAEMVAIVKASLDRPQLSGRAQLLDAIARAQARVQGTPGHARVSVEDKRLLQAAYADLQRQQAAGEVPVYDAGGRLTPEESQQILATPHVQALVREIQALTTDVLAQLGVPTDAIAGIGLLFDRAAYGVYFPDPDGSTRAFILINPFEQLRSGRYDHRGFYRTARTPADAARNVYATIVHEVVHHFVKGHADDFNAAEASARATLGADHQLAAEDRLERLYADPSRRTVLHPDLARPFAGYRRAQQRGPRAADALSRTRSYQARRTDRPGDESGPPGETRAARARTLRDRPHTELTADGSGWLVTFHDPARGGEQQYLLTDRKAAQRLRLAVALGVRGEALDEIAFGAPPRTTTAKPRSTRAATRSLFEDESGSASTEGLHRFLEDDVAPIGRGLAQVATDFKNLVTPQTASPQAQRTADQVAYAKAAIANRAAIDSLKYQHLIDRFDKQTDAANVAAIAEYERTGQFPTDYAPAGYSDLYQKSMTLARTLLMHAYGDDRVGYVENYVRRAFLFDSKADEDKGTEYFLARRRTLSANTSPTKGRVLDVPLDEALASMRERGIKVRPATTNPEVLRQWSLVNAHQAAEYQRVWASLKETDFVTFIPMGTPAKAKAGLVPISEHGAAAFYPKERGLGQYYADPTVARVLNNATSQGLGGYATYQGLRAINNTLNQLQLGLSAFHFTGSAINAGLVDFSTGLRRAARGDYAGAAGVGRSLVPFASFARDLYRGRSIVEGLRTNSPDAYRFLNEQLNPGGGRLQLDARYRNAAARNMVKAWRAGNLLGAGLRLPMAIVETVAKPLMEYAIPRVKIGVFADRAADWDRRHPNASPAERARGYRSVWDQIDNIFGLLVYDNGFWSKTAQDLAQVATRSVGWTGGSLRWGLGAVGDLRRLTTGGGGTGEPPDVPMDRAGADGEGNPRFIPHLTPRMSDRLLDALVLPIYVGLLGAMLQYLYTRKGPASLKDLYHPRTGAVDDTGREERITLPTYMRDADAYATDPVKALIAKQSPLLTEAEQQWTDQDYRHVLIADPHDPIARQWADRGLRLLKEARPIWIEQAQDRPGDSLGTQVGRFFGLTPAARAVTETPMEAYLRSLQPPTPKTQAEAEHQALTRTLRNAVQQGDSATASGVLQQGELSRRSVKQAFKSAQYDWTQRAFRAATLDQALEAYELANPEERQATLPLLLRKFHNTFKDAPASEKATLLVRFQAALKLPKTDGKAAAGQ